MLNNFRHVLQMANFNHWAVPLDQIPYVDKPELRIDEHESVEMPFRYIKRQDGEPSMPEVCYSDALLC